MKVFILVVLLTMAAVTAADFYDDYEDEEQNKEAKPDPNAPEHRFDWAVNGNNYFIDIPDFKREKTLSKLTPSKLLTAMALIKKKTDYAIENENSKFL